MAPRKHQRTGRASGDPQDGQPAAGVAALRIDLEQLELGPQPLEAQIPAAWIASVLAETDAIVSETDGGGIARLELMLQTDRTLLVRGQLELRYLVPCARCLEPAPVDVGGELGDLCVTFVPADRVRSWAEFSGEPGQEDEIEPLETSELDEIGYQGTTVDLCALVSEQLLLAYPMRALCSRGEACRGLCMRCGTELNSTVSDSEAAASCPKCGLRLLPDGSAADDETPDSPWKRALAKVKSEEDL
ncbi:hypothetical protein DB30_01705 [Enhygromyxa salina]|uniref:DUF177 domain-containing protein n=1 Tax=Enhygromyxa salina TaxID=215803 RepID=A0A0C2D4X2_9BACT|nr:DUF177 domain-containing protein [Enhygromyxa salina]KIG18201.1 hypothetical protein DB30_01705 [Enhygromyxa salina]